MNQEPQQQQRKGMSKGCLIALIVIGVVVVLAIIAIVVCYAKRDELVKYGTAQLVGGVKAELAKNPIEGVDTVQINALSDAFIERFEAAEQIDYAKYGDFARKIQAIMEDKTLDSAEVGQYVQAIVDFYPELREMIPPAETTDTLPPGDTVLEER